MVPEGKGGQQSKEKRKIIEVERKKKNRSAATNLMGEKGAG